MGGELATSVHMPAPSGEQGRERWPPRETRSDPRRIFWEKTRVESGTSLRQAGNEVKVSRGGWHDGPSPEARGGEGGAQDLNWWQVGAES